MATFIQVAGVLGIFFLFGFILYFLESFTANCYLKTVGLRGILWTAWLGTPVHEISHALLCILFGHRIVSIDLFNPSPRGNSLGYVSHSYNKNNFYQSMGNFFIGAAPLLIGPVVIMVALYFLVPNSIDIVQLMTDKAGQLNINGDFITKLRIMQTTGEHLFKVLFDASNFSSWQFWVFIYIAVCISSHLAPSHEDMEGVWHGIAVIVVSLLVINLIVSLGGGSITDDILTVNRYTGVFAALFILATVISLVNFMCVFVIFNIYARFAYGQWISPF